MIIIINPGFTMMVQWMSANMKNSYKESPRTWCYQEVNGRLNNPWRGDIFFFSSFLINSQRSGGKSHVNYFLSLSAKKDGGKCWLLKTWKAKGQKGQSLFFFCNFIELFLVYTFLIPLFFLPLSFLSSPSYLFSFLLSSCLSFLGSNCGAVTLELLK